MRIGQKVSSACYDKKDREDELELDEKVFVYLAHNERAKLKYNWIGQSKIIEGHHPI